MPTCAVLGDLAVFRHVALIVNRCKQVGGEDISQCRNRSVLVPQRCLLRPR